MEENSNSRIKSPGDARSIFAKCWRDSEKRRETTSMVRNQLEGGLPYDPQDLISRGTGYMTNVNFRDAEAMRNRAIIPYWRMVHNVPNVISAQVVTQSPDGWRWGKAFADAFDYALKVWGVDYIMHFCAIIEDFVDYGVGSWIWPRDKSTFQSCRYEDVLYPDGHSILREKSELVMIRDRLTVAELYKVAKAGEDSAYAGWHQKEAERLLKMCMKEMDSQVDMESDFTAIMDKLQNNDLSYSARSGGVRVVHFYYRNHDGKINHAIIPESGPADTESKEGEKFLCLEEDIVDSWEEAMGMVLWEVANMQVHGVKGFGIRNFHFAALLNRTKSQVVDSFNVSSSMNFRRRDAGAGEMPVVESFGPYNVWPQGLEQLQVYPQARDAMQIIQMLESNQADNASVYRESQQPIGKVETARQADYLAAMQGEVRENQSELFLVQIGECLFMPLFERLRNGTDKIAKAFQRRAVELGVPEKELKKLEVFVTAGASATLADPAMRQMTWDRIMQLRNEPGVKTREIVKGYIANLMGTQTMKQFVVDDGMESDMLSVQEAVGENADMGQGFPIPVAMENNHVVHLPVHLEPLQAITQKFAQTNQFSQEDIMAVAVGLDHCQEHLQFLQPDETRKNEFKQLNTIFMEVQSIARGMMAKAQQLAQQQQQQGPRPI